MINDYPKMKTVYGTKAALFSFDYPKASKYDPEEIESIIYNHYKSYRLPVDKNDQDEIDEWHDDFAARICEIMPYFNKLYDSADAIIDPLKNIDISEYAETVDESLAQYLKARQKVENDMSESNFENANESGKTSNSTGHTTKEDAESASKNSITEDNDTRETNRAEEASEASESEKANAQSGYTNENSTSATYSENTTASDQNRSTSGNTLQKFSDTPQGAVANLDNGYLTNVTANNGSTSENSGSNESSESSGETDNTSNSSTLSSSAESASADLNRSSEVAENSSENRVSEGSENSERLSSQDITESLTGGENISGSESGTSSQSRERSEDMDEHGEDSRTRQNELNRSKTGYLGLSAGRLLKDYREALVDINSKLIKALSDMFYQLWVY